MLRELDGSRKALGDRRYLLHFFPKIVAMIILPFPRCNSFNIHLHRSCTIVTLFDIIVRTPMHRPCRSLWSARDPVTSAMPPSTLESVREINRVGDSHLVLSTNRKDDMAAVSNRTMRWQAYKIISNPIFGPEGDWAPQDLVWSPELEASHRGLQRTVSCCCYRSCCKM